MIRKIVLSVFLLSLTFLFTACPKRTPQPTPGDTASAFGYNSGDGSYIPGSVEQGNFGRPGVDIDGLEARDDDFLLNAPAFYDANGNLIDVYDANGNPLLADEIYDSSIRSYDANGNPITVYDANGNPLNAYDRNGNPITVYDANGYPTTPYDSSGNLRDLYDANGNPIQAYDQNGNALPSRNANYRASNTLGAGYSQSQVIDAIYFNYDQFYISEEGRSALVSVATDLKSDPGKKILLVGHCSWHGTSEYNLSLGDKRANTVRDYLTNLGVSSSQMEILSRGDLDAIEGGSKQETAQDRRTDIVAVN